MTVKPVTCSIITIGDELLIGQTIDTNSAWIAQELNKIGIWVKRRLAVSDNKEDILESMQQESLHADLIIITGGLGPTADDITKPVLCEYFNSKLVQHKEILQHVIDLFTIRKRPILDVNLQQAMVPDNCTILLNEVGTASGMWFEKNHKVFISLPGVPFEMMHIMTNKAIPELKKYFMTPSILHRTIVTAGEGESFIAQLLQTFEKNLPEHIKLAYLPKLGIVKLRLTAIGIEESEMNVYFDQLKNLLQHISISDSDIEIEEVINRILHSKEETLSIAESCTGGLLCSKITSIKGASNVFKGGFVTYTIESKINILGVNEKIIKENDVISKETVIEMAEKCRDKMNSTYALSISGHLEKQEGKTIVWMAVSNKSKTVTKKIHVFLDRKKNGIMVTNHALNFLRMFILDLL